MKQEQQHVIDSTETRIQSRPVAALITLVGGIIAIIFGMAISVSLGVADVRPSVVWEAVFQYNSELMEHKIIHNLRLPRVLSGAIVGASLAVAGAIMQGMTRNALADSSLLGLNAGAALMLTVSLAFFPALSFHYILLFSFLGAGVGAALVYGIAAANKGGVSTVRLVLAGAAISALLVALSEGISLYFKIGQDIAFWYAQGVAGVNWEQIGIQLPWFVAAMLGAIYFSRSITLLGLGEDVAKGLGQRTGLVKVMCAIIVLILAGSSVALVGTIGFIGLIIPHIVRKLVGVDYRFIIPCSAVLGGLLMIFADLAGRLINPPYETPVAALVAVIGVPFFLYLARKERRF